MKKSIYFYLVFTSVMPIFLRILRKILMARSTNNFWVVISFGQPRVAVRSRSALPLALTLNGGCERRFR